MSVQQIKERDEAIKQATKFYVDGGKKIDDSNFWRFIALVFVWLSLSLFIGGCVFGALAIVAT